MELKFRKLIEGHGEEDDISMEELAEKLMKDKEKVADRSKLPHIHSLDWEYDLSSIFVEVDTPLVHTKPCNSWFLFGLI